VGCYNVPPCFKERSAADYLCAGVVVVASRAGMALAALGTLLNPPTPKREVDCTKRWGQGPLAKYQASQKLPK
jgi:hypothetical protein